MAKMNATATNTFKKGSVFNSSLLTKILRLSASFKSKLLLAMLLTTIIAFLGPVRPFLMQYAIDHFIVTGDMNGLVMISVLLFSLLLTQSGIQVWNTVLTNFIGQEVIKDLRLKVYTYLTSLRLQFYDKTPIGTLVTRTVNDIETIADVFSEGLINIVGDLLQIIFILVLMFWTDWKLSLVSLSVLPFLLYAGYLFKEKVRDSFEAVRTQVARLNTFVQEHIQGMQIVQLFNKQSDAFDAFKSINKDHRDANIRSVFYYSVFFPVVELIAATSTALILWYGSFGALNGTISVGTMIAFIMYINLFFRPIRQLADRFNTLQMGMVAADRIFKLIEDESEIEATGATEVKAIKGDIQFKEVWFGYQEGEYVLKQLSFHVEPGKTLALVGATGAGKSSIISLINRYYEINRGVILLDHQNLYDLNIQQVRKQMAVVLQDVFLFSGTVMDNIRLYNKSISDEAIISMSKKLGAHNFISKLPNGYQQQVQERGLTLSVGQRQLISFVRAMVTEPAILILDEATASIDHETESVIQSAINKMLVDRTSIIIAHRLSTIQHADEILVLEKGEIVEQGNHSQLLALNGYYKKLYEIQFAAQLGS